MTCGRLGPTELMLIALLILLLFGASRLPEIGRGLGLGIKRFKKSLREEEEEEEPKQKAISDDDAKSAKS
ncbi:MAG: twin-arginine translocase TatA/TatE family subunit [Candidatus Latescibacterota bacterium]|nr:MAG: twin-arginine translocase TatA/TatE family subunit [Candidatus Latescibacterota bacterium]